MPKFPLRFPPGLYRNGTRYQAAGRWFESNLVRWFEKAMRPVGGWQPLVQADADFDPEAQFELVAHAEFTAADATELQDYVDPVLGQFNAGSSGTAGQVTIQGNRVVQIVTGSFTFVAFKCAIGTLFDGFDISIEIERSASASTNEVYGINFRSATGATLTTDNVTLHAQRNAANPTTQVDLVLGQRQGAVAATTTVATGVALALGARLRIGARVSGDTVTPYYAAEDGSGVTLLTPVTLPLGALTSDFNDASHDRVGIYTRTNVDCEYDNLRIRDLNQPATPTDDVQLSGVPRSALAWRQTLVQAATLAVGTNTKLFAWTQGALTDITPAGLVTGGADTVYGAGAYGAGFYGAFAYGAGDPTQTSVIEAATWQLDTFGQFLVACLTSDGKLYYWDPATSQAVLMDASAPVDCLAVVVTPERFVVALGADGDPRSVRWADRESLTVWTPLSTNQAGDFPLPTNGAIMAGRRTRSETLIWTDEGVHAMRFSGGTLVYSFEELGKGCGLISRNGVAIVDNTKAVWMGSGNFYIYDGFVRPLPSDVSDSVFRNMNITQRHKIVAVPQARFGEVWWFYPSAGSLENDSVVVWNYVEDHWALHSLSRTAGVDRSPFDYPILIAADGFLYEHERGFDRDGAVPYAESGPLEVAEGERVMNLKYIIPDENTLGDVVVSLYHSLYPTEAESLAGPYPAGEPTDIRLSARQVRLRIEEEQPGDWRVGVFRIEADPGSRR